MMTWTAGTERDETSMGIGEMGTGCEQRKEDTMGLVTDDQARTIIACCKELQRAAKQMHVLRRALTNILQEGRDDGEFVALLCFAGLPYSDGKPFPDVEEEMGTGCEDPRGA